MRRRSCPLTVVAVVMLIGLPGPGVAGDGEAITIVGSPALLPVGTRCRVELKPLDEEAKVVEMTYEGTVVEAKDDGIDLRVSELRRCVSLKSPLASIPGLDRLTRNVGIGRLAAGKEMIVSMAAGEIRSVRCLP